MWLQSRKENSRKLNQSDKVITQGRVNKTVQCNLVIVNTLNVSNAPEGFSF